MSLRIALAVTPFSEHNLIMAEQVGVQDIVSRWPTHYGLPLRTIRDRVRAHGMECRVVEGYLPHDLIVHAKEGREAQLTEITEGVREMGDLGFDTLCYNFMPDDDWSRTSVDTKDRGGSLVTAFDASLAKRSVFADTSHRLAAEPITAAQLWDSISWFLERLLPVAEAAGVRLSLHPDDAPMAHLNGQDRIFSSPAAFDELFRRFPHPANGMCLCQGSFASMGDESIPGLIRHFGEWITYAHFRDVTGKVPVFQETWHDLGKTDMAACMRAYRDIGYTGAMRPDHVPTMIGEDNSLTGYHMLGRLWAVGYMRGLLHGTAPAAE